jgi:hypothetical protein
MAIGQELLNVPMGEMIYSMASAIARSQLELDHASIESAEMMGGLKTIIGDDGKATFTDSRVFFGHEYMTIPEAMATQGGEGNPTVEKLVASQTLKYKKYNLPSPLANEATLNTEDIDDPVSAAGVTAYYQNVQVIKDRISQLQATVANPATTSGVVTAAKTTLGLVQALQLANDASAANIFERQVQVPTRVSLLELGFAPVFYAFVDTIIEVKISISITQESSSTTTTETTGRSVQGSFGFRGIPFLRARMNRTREVSTSQVNGTYSTRYSHTAEGSSLLRTKLSPVPTPAVLEERIRGMMAADQERKAAMLRLLTTPPPPALPAATTTTPAA